VSVSRSLRDVVTLVAVVTLLLAVVAPASVAADEIRTDPGEIAGFGIDASATPITVRIFEPTIPIPADPGNPNFEIALGFSSTTLGAGPVSRAVSSLVWPGAGVGDGFGNFAEEFGMDPDSTYPLRAMGQYPSGEPEESMELPTGAGMHAAARGLDVEAETEFVGDLVPGLAAAGGIRSRSTSTVVDGEGRAVADAVLSKVELLEGLIVIDQLRTRLVATSDGVDASVRGATEFSGLTIAGTRFALGHDGATIVEEDEEGGSFDEVPTLPLRLRGVADLSDLIGVKVELAPVEDDVEEEFAAAGRVAGGLVVTIDATTLFDLLRLLPADVLLEQLPDDLSSQLRMVLGLAPTFEITLGRAVVDASGTEPLSFDMPDMDFGPPPPLGDEVMGDDFTFEEGADLGFADADLGSGPPPAAGFDGPEVASDLPPGAAQPQAFAPAASFPDPFGGLPAPAILLAAIAIAFTGFGLQRLTGAALAAPIAAAACTATSTGVPDLRQQAGR
jgi:hypothetical protein